MGLSRNWQNEVFGKTADRMEVFCFIPRPSFFILN